MKIELNKKKQIKNYHEALNDLLALWVASNGFDYNVVCKSLKALAQNTNLPLTYGFIDKINEL